jgi:branched-chain amino acid transport system substrate-binding protein
MLTKLGLAAVTALALLAGGCGSGGGKVLRIGVVVDCEGVFSSLTDPVLAAAELPLLERGGRLAARTPVAGVRGTQVDGTRIEIREGCGEITYLTQLIENIRRLVEADHVDVVVAPLIGNADGIVVRKLAHRYPGVAFVIGYSGAQETTLRDPAPNLFRFVPDAVQGQAGLGTYAYRDLGWRRAAVVFSDDQLGWPQAAGFVAEFCSLGGSVQRLPTGEGASAAALPRLAGGTDGVALLTQYFPDTLAFAAAYRKTQPDLVRHLVLGSSALSFLDPATFAKSAPLWRGLVVSGFSHDGQNAAWTRFRNDYGRRFPGLASPTSPADFQPTLTYYDAVEATMRALERAHGFGPPFLRALAATRLDAPDGSIRLDRNRQAIVTMHLSRVEVGARGPTIRTFRDLSNVEQTFGGYFSATTPTPTATRPGCHTAIPPAWTHVTGRRETT